MIHKIGLDLYILGGLGTTVDLPTGTGLGRISGTGGCRRSRPGFGLGIPEGWDHGADTGPQFFEGELGWRKVEHGSYFFVLGRRARRVHALGLSMLASYYVKPKKFQGLGTRQINFFFILAFVSYLCVPVSISFGLARVFCVSEISKIIPAQRNRFIITQHV